MRLKYLWEFRFKEKYLNVKKSLNPVARCPIIFFEYLFDKLATFYQWLFE